MTSMLNMYFGDFGLKVICMLVLAEACECEDVFLMDKTSKLCMFG